ncbi:CaiB/BaiF CoA-transferase family protein [Pigmentiphaga soli]|uniref:CaiB/BaiF CoA-transferase family protein n=1 Tax=Pigmentiphaga soli TaxID=1007095 RepID=A0ABP8H9M9_9BURK
MGPLAGIKIVELAGIGPGPMCAMLLADLGATVLRVDRQQAIEQGNPRPLKYNLLLRNRKAIAVDLKRPGGVALVLRLAEQADALIEGFRPGVTECLGLGPEDCWRRNPKLVYGRITGWGQDGPLATVAAHDLNYISLTGALHAIGRAGQPPTPPLNLVGDYGGGALYLALGVLAAILEARQSGRGQVVDAAIVDGAASLMTSLYGLFAAGIASTERGTNNNDSGAYFYDCYQCADGLWVSVAALEGRFFAELLRRLEIDPDAVGVQRDRANWPKARALFAERFRTRTRAEWCARFEGADACFAPVLSMAEAPQHPHNRARGAFLDVDGVVQPAPAPRFSRTPAAVPEPPAPITPGNTAAALRGWIDAGEVEALRAAGTLG